MRFARIAWVACLTLCLASAGAAAALSAGGDSSDPPISGIEISPTGSSVAYVVKTPEGSFLIVSNLVTGDARKLEVSEIEVRNVEWSGPNHVLLYASANDSGPRQRRDFVGVFSVDVNDGKVSPLLGHNKNLAAHGRLDGVEAVLWQEDGSVLMAAPTTRRSRYDGHLDLLKVSGRTGYGRILAKGSKNTRDWIVTPAGRIVARVDHGGKARRLRVLVPEDRGILGSSWRPVYTRDAAAPDVEVLGLAAAGDALILGGRLAGDRYALYRMSLADGALEPLPGVPSERSDTAVHTAIVDRYTGVVIGATYAIESVEQQFFDQRFTRVLDAVREIRPNWRVSLRSWDRKYNRFILCSEALGEAGAFYLFDRSERQLILLARGHSDPARASLALEPLGEIRKGAPRGSTSARVLRDPPDVAETSPSEGRVQDPSEAAEGVALRAERTARSEASRLRGEYLATQASALRGAPIHAR